MRNSKPTHVQSKYYQQGTMGLRSRSPVPRMVTLGAPREGPHGQWNHAAHLTVTIWYMIRFDEADASERMIHGVRRYNRAQGIRTTPTGGYHETITLFWLTLASKAAERVFENASLLETINRFVRFYAEQKDLLYQYCTRDLLFSTQARRSWVEPNLKQLNDAIGMQLGEPPLRQSATSPD